MLEIVIAVFCAPAPNMSQIAFGGIPDVALIDQQLGMNSAGSKGSTESG